MQHYILIDNYTGTIFYDTRDLPGFDDSDGSPIAAARLGDQSIGEYDRRYCETYRPNDTRTGYHVYAIDDTTPPIHDGTDDEIIANIEICDAYIGFIEIKGGESNEY
jgi:hypothetical protein